MRNNKKCVFGVQCTYLEREKKNKKKERERESKRPKGMEREK